MAKEKFIPPVVKCTSCDLDSNYLGRIPFRIGGETGLLHLVMGDFADFQEDHFSMDLFRCENCGHIDMFDFQKKIKDYEK